MGTFTENIGSVGRIDKENEHCNDVTFMATTALNHNEAVPVDVAAIVTAMESESAKINKNSAQANYQRILSEYENIPSP